ncbi:MAG: hypothetical protein H8E94_07380 [Alphaproteobacteria bacterium]|nr:hypothetical protein [Alphaproteobacteria bacterium]
MTEKPKRRWWKWIAIPLGASVVLYGIATALANLNVLQKPMHYAHSHAAAFASSVHTHELYYSDRGYPLEWKLQPGWDKPTCKSDNTRFDGLAPYWYCINIGNPLPIKPVLRR